jgi:hypothetical protein
MTTLMNCTIRTKSNGRRIIRVRVWKIALLHRVPFINGRRPTNFR